MSSTEPPIPFREPPYLAGLPSPYYKPTHLAFQKRCRAFVDEHMLPHALQWERDGDVPPEIFPLLNKHNMLLPNLPAPLPVDWLSKCGIHDILGVPVAEWDYIHTYIYCDEMARPGLTGIGSSLSAGMAFGIPPLIKFGSESLKGRFLGDALTGRTRWCLAITEPDAGSDVANITTTAEKSEDGKFYVVTGTKKWITNGIWSDYATMAVRTGGEGPKGLSMIVCPLKGDAVEMRRLKVGGQESGGTTFIDLDEVKVPVENLIGEEGKGMQYIMTNFNHERLTMGIGAARSSRVALSLAFEYCLKREAFGKVLMDQPVVRHRLAKAGAQLETLQSWIDQTVYQMVQLPRDEANIKLGGLTAMLKAQAGIVLNECAQTAVLLLGGNGYTRSGQGELAEKIYREVFGLRIPGGSEDVLLDLGVRQLVKNYLSAKKKAGDAKL